MKTRFKRLFRYFLILFAVSLASVCFKVVGYYASDNHGWYGADGRGSSLQAPDADADTAVIQVYAARAARWRGALGVHTWIATKRTDERRYTRLEVIGYRTYWGGDAVRIRNGSPDSMWFGNRPVLLREIVGGAEVDTFIDTLYGAAQSYPYNNDYRVWPGPNSNTFIAHLARQVPQLRLELPSTAIGKDYLPGGGIVEKTPSGVGIQISAAGYAGVLAGLEEGIEINLLGLTSGIDFYPPAIKLPGIGRIGFSDTKRYTFAD